MNSETCELCEAFTKKCPKRQIHMNTNGLSHDIQIRTANFKINGQNLAHGDPSGLNLAHRDGDPSGPRGPTWPHGAPWGPTGPHGAPRGPTAPHRAPCGAHGAPWGLWELSELRGSSGENTMRNQEP